MCSINRPSLVIQLKRESRRLAERTKNVSGKINNESYGEELQVKESADNEDEVE